MLKDTLLNLNLVIDNEWLDKYVNLIESNINTPRQNYKTQKHHIIPKYYYRYIKKPINNSDDNLVNLLYKDHILAHYYLALCSSNDHFVYSNYNAIQYSLSKQNIDENTLNNLKLFVNSLDKLQELYERSLKDYSSEERRKRISEATKKAMQRPEVRAKITNRPGSMLGKKFSDEHRRKISESNRGKEPWNKGKKMSAEYCKIHSECQKGIKKTMSEEGRKSFRLKQRQRYLLDKNHKYIQCIETSKIYDFANDAAFDIFPERTKRENTIVSQHIVDCCKGRRKSAYNYTWRYYEKE